ncbi:MAG: extracellular solute-binding protein [Rhodospirillales bacterium]|nr:extracellular solute-binding protein [Rhodospirillales bacterium]
MKHCIVKKLIALSLAGLVTGIFSASADAGMDKAAIDALYQKAKKEGKVVVWGPQLNALQYIAEGFGKEFPGIEVVVAASLRSGTKIIAEAKAKRYTLDTFVFPISSGMLPLFTRKLLAKFPWKEFGVPKEKQFLDGHVAALNNLAYVVVYNTDYVKPNEVPDKWEDLLHPRWKGRLLGSPFLFPHLMSYFNLEWSDEKTAAYTRAMINEQKIMLARGPREGLLKSGERHLVVGDFVQLAKTYRDHGVPVKYKFMDLTPSPQFTSAVMANAPHPNAARLLAGWLTTEAAVILREKKAYMYDLLPSSKSEVAKEMRASGTKQILETAENLEARKVNHKKFLPIITGRKK